jgi:hypothetical protein
MSQELRLEAAETAVKRMKDEATAAVAAKEKLNTQSLWGTKGS